jgi:hypothetical protein
MGNEAYKEGESFFKPEDVIYTYTDGQAVEDGVLVAINPRDRVTRTVWEYFVEKAPKGSEPPNRWPVSMMDWFTASKISKTDAAKMIAEFGKDQAQEKFSRMIADRKALALSKGIISTHASQAKRVYDENTDGGIYKLYGHLDPAGILFQLGTEPHGVFCTLWLMPNENNGTTLMFSEDY